jgi:ATP-dependent DNA helicase RecQ
MDWLKDEDIRLLYVAITRAKKNLFIHDVGSIFDSIKVGSIGRYPDATKYDVPNEIAISLTHRDIALGYCAYTNRTIDKLYSGMTMITTDLGCSVHDGDVDKPVLKYSKSFLDRLKELDQKGYRPADAVVNNIVFWFDGEKEFKIVLPTLRFTKIISYNDIDINKKVERIRK